MHAWLRLANLQISARAANALLDHFGSPEAIFDATAAEFDRVEGLSSAQAGRVLDPSFIPTDQQLAYVESARVEVIHRGHADYPRNLKEIPDPPAVLFARGSLAEPDRFAVAVVGSRQATPYGRTIAGRLARDLAQAGITVVSGGALGIDAAAHHATVEAGGRTLVVLGCGLDVEYPRANQRLFQQVVERGQGAVLTEYPPGATPEPWRFPLRNRVISGLSMAVVVVEAGAHSGALVTATAAAEQGRDVMAVPGNVDRETSRGCNGLIRDGAVLVETAQDVLRALGVLVLENPAPREASGPGRSGPDRAAIGVPAALPDGQRRLLEFLSLTPRHIDALAADVSLPSVQVSVEMTMLELAGLVRRLPGNCYIRAL